MDADLDLGRGVVVDVAVDHRVAAAQVLGPEVALGVAVAEGELLVASPSEHRVDAGDVDAVAAPAAGALEAA